MGQPIDVAINEMSIGAPWMIIVEHAKYLTACDPMPPIRALRGKWTRRKRIHNDLI